MGGGGCRGGDLIRTIIDMPNIIIFYGRPFSILAWNNYFGLKLS